MQIAVYLAKLLYQYQNYGIILKLFMPNYEAKIKKKNKKKKETVALSSSGISE